MELYKKPKGLTEKSLKMYDEKYNNHIKPRIGTMKMKDVKDVHLQKIMNAQAGMSESHAKKIRIVLQEMFKRARISRIIVYDPAEILELPQTTKGRRRAVTDEERRAIEAVAKEHPAGRHSTPSETTSHPNSDDTDGSAQKHASHLQAEIRARGMATSYLSNLQSRSSQLMSLANILIFPRLLIPNNTYFDHYDTKCRICTTRF
jgi:hypothetical protein